MSGARVAQVQAHMLSERRMQAPKLRQRTLTGLTDGHGHLGLLADAYRFVDVSAAKSESDVVALLAALPPAEGWLVARDFDQNKWPGQHLPTAAALSKAFPARPVFIRRVDHHAAWVNAAAMETLGEAFTARHPREWIQDGVLFEGAADAALASLPRPNNHTANIARAAAALRGAGFTGVHDMATRTWDLTAFEALGNALAVRVHCYLYDDNPKTYDKWLRALPTCENPLVTVVGVKLFLDGALGSRGARLQSAYSDCPNHHGHHTLPLKDAQDLVERAFANNLRVALHAIGDAAVHDAVAIITAASKKTGAPASLARIEHAQVVADEDVEAIAKLGVSVGVQFVQHRDDAPWLEARLGHDRLRLESRWRTLLNAGINLVGGSDFPIASFALADAIAAAAGHGKESLDKFEVLTAYTRAPHKAIGQPPPGSDRTLWDDDAGRPVMSWLNGDNS